MSEPIGVGDFVECVDASPGWIDGDRSLALGAVYSVVKIIPCLHGLTAAESAAILLREVAYKGPAAGWDISRFRPVYRPSQSLFLTRLMDTPADPEQVMA